MKNKASQLPDAFPDDPIGEFKLLIEKDGEQFNVYMYLDGVLNKVLYEVNHYQLETPFGNDAE